MEKQYKEIDEKKGWNRLFQELRQKSSLDEQSYTVAKQPKNKDRNRYRDVLPYDHSRIRLKKSQSDYINANLVESPYAKRRYILTQGPLPGTCGHFWEMIWGENSLSIVMLNRVMEKGSVKCHQYWPDDTDVTEGDNEEDRSIVFEDTQFKVILLDEKEKAHYFTRTLSLENLATEEVRLIYHFHYVAWPDFGVPHSPLAFLAFLADVRKSGSLSEHVGPPVVHCSAGIGRSGTFCLVDSCLVMIEQSSSTENIDVIEKLMDMRTYRMGLIQTAEQLRFSFQAVIEGAHYILHEGLETLLSIEDLGNQGPPKPPHRQLGVEEDVAPPLPPRRNRAGADGQRISPPPPPQISQEEEEQYDNLNTATPLGEEETAAETQVRKRKREDRIKATSDKIAKMKKKQEDSERNRNRSLWTPVIFTTISVCAITYLLYRYWL